jgi:hypothetical protein
MRRSPSGVAPRTSLRLSLITPHGSLRGNDLQAATFNERPITIIRARITSPPICYHGQNGTYLDGGKKQTGNRCSFSGNVESRRMIMTRQNTLSTKEKRFFRSGLRSGSGLRLFAFVRLPIPCSAAFQHVDLRLVRLGPSSCVGALDAVQHRLAGVAVDLPPDEADQQHNRCKHHEVATDPACEECGDKPHVKPRTRSTYANARA